MAVAISKVASPKKAVNLQVGRGPGKGGGVKVSTKSGADRKAGKPK